MSTNELLYLLHWKVICLNLTCDASCDNQGKQPFGQFPPGWDAGLEGICVGERRRLIVPPVLAYGSAGLPRRGIPPNSTLQYDVTLVSINGLATPQ